MMEAKHLLNITPPHAVLELESTFGLVHQVLALLQQGWNHLIRVSRARNLKYGPEPELDVTHHLPLNV